MKCVTRCVADAQAIAIETWTMRELMPHIDWPTGKLHGILGVTTSTGERGRLSPTPPTESDGAAEGAAGDRRFRMAHSLQAATCNYSRLPLYVYVGARRASGPKNARGGNQ